MPSLKVFSFFFSFFSGEARDLTFFFPFNLLIVEFFKIGNSFKGGK